MDLAASKKKVEALTAPRNAVLVGASDRPGSWAARVWRNLNRYEFPGKVYLINPRRTEIWDQPCYPDFKSLPEPPDHMVVLVPAAGVIETLKAGAAAGARSATVFSAGFGEAYDNDAVALGHELAAVITDTGLGVSGPNCMGNVCAKSRLVTLTEDRPLKLRAGPVALVGQSGGMMIFANAALEERGLSAEYLITSGNERGLTAGDYIAFFADQPELKVIVIYVEAISDLDKFKAACLMARAAGKHIVALKLGQSEGGRQAALAHTGSLAGSVEAFDAVAGEVGVIRADTLDDVVEVTEFLAHTGAAGGGRLSAITLSGAFRGLLLDGAERNRLQFPALAQATTDKLNSVLTVGSLVSNPIDGGFGVLTSADNYKASIEALQADPNVDIVLLQESLPREPGSARAESYIAMVEDYLATTRSAKPMAFVTPTSYSNNDYSRALRAKAPHVSFLQEANKALRAIASVARRDELEALRRTAVDDAPRTDAQRARRARRRRTDRLSDRAQGGCRHAHPQVGRGRGRAQPRDSRGHWRGLRPDDRRTERPYARRHAGLPAGARRARARARPPPRSRNGPGGDGRFRRRAARADQGRGVLCAAGKPRKSPRHAPPHPRRPPDRRLSGRAATRPRGGGRRAGWARTPRHRPARRDRVGRHQPVRGAA